MIVHDIALNMHRELQNAVGTSIGGTGYCDVFRAHQTCDRPWPRNPPASLRPHRAHAGRRRLLLADVDGLENRSWQSRDLRIIGYGGKTVNALRPCAARNSEPFDMQIFDTGDFIKVVEQKAASAAISKVPCPTGVVGVGKELHLVQAYFLVACSLNGELREFDRCGHPIKMAMIGRGIVLVLGLSVCIFARAAGATPALDDEVWAGMYSSFYTPLGQLLDGSAEESLSARYALDVPMKSPPIVAAGSGLQGEPASSPTLQFSLKYVPLTSWFASITFLKYLRGDLQKQWNPDFAYVFGYDDWHPYTFSAQYANYGGNRLNPNTAKGERRTNFMAGSWNVSYKFPLPEPLESLMLISSDHAMGCTAGATLTPRFSDSATNKVLDNKRTLALGCKYSFGNNWYFNFSVPHYLVKKQQQPWDPDFTYGFGYFDWHPATWSIQYNNYSGNRFPWNPPSPRTGRLKDGSISISIGANWL